jgi:hypothetical protein
MRATPLFLPPHVVRALKQVAARTEDLAVDDIVAAAARAFNRQHATSGKEIVRAFWYSPGRASAKQNGSGHRAAVKWSVLVLHKSQHELLGKVDGKPFSKLQTLVAVLAWFVAQPADLQDELISDYLEFAWCSPVALPARR